MQGVKFYRGGVCISKKEKSSSGIGNVFAGLSLFQGERTLPLATPVLDCQLNLFYNKTIFSMKQYFISMANQSIKKYTDITSVLSFKTLVRSCFYMYQLYFSIYRLAHPRGL